MKIQYSLQFPFPDVTRVYDVRYEKPEFEGFRVSAAESFPLSLTFRKNRVLAAEGSGSLKLMIPCDRCLTETEVSVSFEIRDELHLDTHTDAEGEAVFCLDEEEYLDTDLLAEPFISMNIPMKVLCTENCKGICERCGANLNLGPCACQKTEAPTKMAEALMKALQNTNFD
ncbi:MAG: DUF177 domain-containing protein [Lachnospiraceae bacterium]|nr:DUF177 domain-containing protein [Lachnospiraceae bacterium]